MKNVFQDMPYAEGKMGHRQLINEKHMQVMQIALKPGQRVPEHNANSNVHLLVIEGQIAITLDGEEKNIVTGSLLPVAYKTLMNIRNKGEENASFLVFKTPNPSEMDR